MSEPGRYEGLRQAYERPTFGLRCGRESLWEKPCPLGPNPDGSCGGETDCRPFKKGDHWDCRRPSSAGGPCHDGPKPDGSCSVRRPRCVPHSTLRVARGRLAWLAAGLVIALIAALFGAGCGPAPSPLDPGPLSAKHASFVSDPTTGLPACQKCHEAHGKGPAGLLASLGQGNNASAHCADCHSFTSASTGASLAAKAHTSLFAGKEGVPDIHCAVCHSEHKGADADLTAVPDAKCRSCHAMKFASFSHGHPDFRAGFPYAQHPSLRFDHQKHFSQFFKDPAHAALAPKACADCHDVQAAASKVPPKGFGLTCAPCHGRQMQDPMSLIRLTAAASGVKAQPTAIEAFILSGSTVNLSQEMLKKGSKPLADLLAEKAGEAEARELLAGTNEDLLKGGFAAWKKGQTYDLANEEPPMGGWFWSGDLMVEPMELKYKPTGHADPVVRAWLDFSVQSAKTAKSPETRKAAEALRDKLLHVKEGVGKCMKCHVLTSHRSGWRFSGAPPHPFVHFSHPAHLRLAELQDCTKCHAPGEKGSRTAFQPIAKETCLRCHGEGKVAENCRLCHFYHPQRRMSAKR